MRAKSPAFRHEDAYGQLSVNRTNRVSRSELQHTPDFYYLSSNQHVDETNVKN